MVLYFLAILAAGTAFWMNELHHMHMFQLNSYKSREHFHWLRANSRELVGIDVWFLLAAVCFCFGFIGRIAGSLLLVVVAWFLRPRKAKKPLVYTKRVIRMFVTLGILFLAICIIIIVSVKCRWALPVMVLILLIASPFFVFLANIINRPLEKAVCNYYIRDAARMLKEMPQMLVIGVTGSYGKTSVKFYLQKLLSAKYNVLITPENYNTTLGVVKTIRENLKTIHEVFICEMGAKNVGDIKEICDLVKPNHGIITSIGPQHLESFQTIENVIRTKFELADAIRPEGMVFLNTDNEFIRNKTINNTVVTYGVEQEAAQYHPFDVRVSAKGSAFRMILDGQEWQFETALIGMHNVVNVAGAIAVAHKLGVPAHAIVQQVRRLEGVPHRLSLMKGGQALIIDDAYNSNPSGAKAALDTLAMFDGAKIIVTPGMIELGDRQYECNHEFGMQIAKVCDYVVLIGPKQTAPIQEGLLKAGYPKEQIYVASKLGEGMEHAYAFKNGNRQKVILIENDLPDNYEG